LTAAGYDAMCLCGDILDPIFPAKLVNGVIARFGKINILINNAGMRKIYQISFDSYLLMFGDL
jgi:short-subunit dehydrogenase involved in D-alanine esterification of teichoic acids